MNQYDRAEDYLVLVFSASLTPWAIIVRNRDSGEACYNFSFCIGYDSCLDFFNALVLRPIQNYKIARFIASISFLFFVVTIPIWLVFFSDWGKQQVYVRPSAPKPGERIKAFGPYLKEYLSMNTVEIPSSETTHHGGIVIVDVDKVEFHQEFLTSRHEMIATCPDAVKAIALIKCKYTFLTTYSGGITIAYSGGKPIDSDSNDPLWLLYKRGGDSVTVSREDTEIKIVDRKTNTVIGRTTFLGFEGPLPIRIFQAVRYSREKYSLDGQVGRIRGNCGSWRIVFKGSEPYFVVMDDDRSPNVWRWILSLYSGA